MFHPQAQELRKYFKSLGAEISEEKSAKGIEDDLHKIVGVCDVCFKDGDPQEIDSILNSIVSIMVSVSGGHNPWHDEHSINPIPLSSRSPWSAARTSSSPTARS